MLPSQIYDLTQSAIRMMDRATLIAIIADAFPFDTEENHRGAATMFIDETARAKDYKGFPGATHV